MTSYFKARVLNKGRPRTDTCSRGTERSPIREDKLKVFARVTPYQTGWGPWP